MNAKSIYWFDIHFFNLKIQNFDLLADYIGLVLIYLGLKEYPDIVYFRKAKKAAIVPLAISLFEDITIIFATNMSPETNKTLLLALLPVTLIAVICFVILVFFITKAIGELEQKTEQILNYNKLYSAWKKQSVFILSATLPTTVYTLLAANRFNYLLFEMSLDLAEIITVFTIIIGIIALATTISSIVYISYFYKAKKVLDNYHPEEYVPEKITSDEFVSEEQPSDDD